MASKFCQTNDCEMIFLVSFNSQFSELLMTMSIFSCSCAICISSPVKHFFKGIFLIDHGNCQITSPLICRASLNHISFQIQWSACIYLIILLIVVWLFWVLALPNRGGVQKNLELFIKNYIFILTCSNFSHLQSTLYLVQHTYQGILSTANNSF